MIRALALQSRRFLYPPGRRPMSPFAGGLNRSTQHFILKGKDGSVMMDRGFRRGFVRSAAPRLRGERKCDSEDRAALRLVLCDDLTIVSVDDRSRNRQAHAHALCFCGKERGEGSVEFLRRYT